MDGHRFDPEQADSLEDPGRYRLLSREELIGALTGSSTVVDIGSGTGFFTDDIARVAETVYAVDNQAEMHAYYRQKGLPENVTLRQADAAAIDDLRADAAVSILSAHEIDLEATLSTLQTVLTSGGTLFVVDWSVNAVSDDGPPLDHRYSAAEATAIINDYFDIERTAERFDTFLIEATTAG